MKKLALFLLASSAFGACGGWTNGYGFCRTVTVDHTKVPNTDQTNFPVGIAATLSYLATLANGGMVQSATGLDILFTSDTAGTSVLNFERVNYSATSGAVEFWIQIPTLKTASDTVFYMYYGKAGVSDPSNAAATWTGASYRNVYHFGDGSTVSITDSVGNNNLAFPGTTHNPTASAGAFGGAATFAAASVQYLSNNTFQANNRSIEVWEKTTTAGYMIFVDNRDSGGSPGLNIFIDPSKHPYLFCNTGANNIFGTAAIGDGNWHTIVGASDQPGNSVALYADGVSQGTPLAAFCGGTLLTHVGVQFDNSAFPLTGSIDEIRFRDMMAPTTADWAATEANNNTQGTFYAISGQVASAIPGQFPRVQ